MEEAEQELLTVLGDRREAITGVLRELHQIDQVDRGPMAGINAGVRAAQKLALERQLEGLKGEVQTLERLAEGYHERRERDRQYWFQRFHTSLAIAHGGALAAIASKLLSKDVPPLGAKVAIAPFVIFAIGLVIAGAIPLALYRDKRHRGQQLANTSAGLFVSGLGVTVASLIVLAWPSLLPELINRGQTPGTADAATATEASAAKATLPSADEFFGRQAIERTSEDARMENDPRAPQAAGATKP